MWHADQYKAFLDTGSERPGSAPNFVVWYIVMGPLLLGAAVVGIFGWSWVALVAFSVIVVAVVAGFVAFHRRRRAQQPPRIQTHPPTDYR